MHRVLVACDACGKSTLRSCQAVHSTLHFCDRSCSNRAGGKRALKVGAACRGHRRRIDLSLYADVISDLYVIQRLSLRRTCQKLSEMVTPRTVTGQNLVLFLQERGILRTLTESRQQPTYQDRECQACASIFSPKGPSTSLCTVCVPNNDAYARYKARGLTQPQFERLLALQDSACALCCRSFATIECHRSPINVDHDHVSGRVRGLLCTACNVSLGHYECADKPAIERYLRAPPFQHLPTL
jgi:hypothetical protein